MWQGNASLFRLFPLLISPFYTTQFSNAWTTWHSSPSQTEELTYLKTQLLLMLLLLHKIPQLHDTYRLLVQELVMSGVSTSFLIFTFLLFSQDLTTVMMTVLFLTVNQTTMLWSYPNNMDSLSSFLDLNPMVFQNTDQHIATRRTNLTKRIQI